MTWGETAPYWDQQEDNQSVIEQWALPKPILRVFPHSRKYWV